MIIVIILVIIGGFIYIFASDKKIELPDIDDLHLHYKDRGYDDDLFDSDFDSNGLDDSGSDD